MIGPEASEPPVEEMNAALGERAASALDPERTGDTKTLAPTKPDSTSPEQTVALFDSSETVSGYERSPEDLLRAISFALATLVVVFVSKFFAQTISGFQEGMVSLLGIRSAVAVQLLYILLAALSLGVGALTLLVPLFTRRFRLFGYVLLVNVLAAGAMAAIEYWVGPEHQVTNTFALSAGIPDNVGPDGAAVAQASGAFVVLAPFITRSWRSLLWVVLGMMVALQIAVMVHPPASTAAALTIGPLVASIVLLAFGRPSSRPTIPAIMSALASSGFAATKVTAADVDARGSTPYIATLADGTMLFTKVMGANERAADLLFRSYRRLRLKNVGDEPPDSSLRRTVEHEALVALSAHDRGILTPRLRTMVRVGQDSFLLAYDLIPGRSLDSVEPDELTDAVLQQLWTEVGKLQQTRIAHRDLRLANVFLGDDGQAWIIDFGFSEVAAPQDVLRADIAQLLASLSIAVGATRAVESTVGALGKPAVGSSLGRIQVAAFSGATQKTLKSRPGLLEEVRAEVAESCDLDNFELDPLVRFKPSHGLGLLVAAAITFIGLPVLVGISAVADAFQTIQWSSTYGVTAFVLVALGGAALALRGAARVRLALTPVYLLQFASTYATTTAPARYGASKLQIRFLERHGLRESDSEQSTAATTISHAAVHISLAVLFVTLAATQSLQNEDIDSTRLIQGAVGVVLVAAIASLMPSVRHKVASQTRALIRRGMTVMPQVVASPSAASAVLLGSGIAIGMQLAAFHLASDMLSLKPGLAVIGAVYLVGAGVAAIAPTPGHVIAVEFALVAGLLAVGVPAAAAVLCVLAYRAISFWAVGLVGWGCFRWLRTNQHV